MRHVDPLNVGGAHMVGGDIHLARPEREPPDLRTARRGSSRFRRQTPPARERRRDGRQPHPVPRPTGRPGMPSGRNGTGQSPRERRRSTSSPTARPTPSARTDTVPTRRRLWAPRRRHSLRRSTRCRTRRGPRRRSSCAGRSGSRQTCLLSGPAPCTNRPTRPARERRLCNMHMESVPETVADWPAGTSNVSPAAVASAVPLRTMTFVSPFSPTSTR